MRILKKGNSSTKSLAYTTPVLPILEYGAVFWDPYREGQIRVLDRVQKKDAKFAYHTNESNWETLSQRRKISRTYAHFKAYSGTRAWQAIGDRLQWPYYWASLIMDGKSGTGSIGRISENIPLWIGPFDSGTGYLQKFWGLPSVNQILLERELGRRLMWWTEENVCWKLSKKCSEVKWSVVQWRGGGISGRIMKVIYGWWSEVKVVLKLICNNCGLTISVTRFCTSFPLCCLYYLHCC